MSLHSWFPVSGEGHPFPYLSIGPSVFARFLPTVSLLGLSPWLPEDIAHTSIKLSAQSHVETALCILDCVFPVDCELLFKASRAGAIFY